LTRTLFALLLSVIVLNGIGAYILGASSMVTRRITLETRSLTSLVGVVGILFGLFLSFNSSDISQRGGNLRLVTEREVGAARSLLNFSSGVGPTAEPIKNAVLEYLTIVTTTERDWFESGGKGDAPSEASVYSLALVTTLFAEQTKKSDVIKTLMLARVDDLTNARTERVTRMTRSADVALWGALVTMAIITQLVGAFGLAGLRIQMGAFLLSYTLVALVGLGYLGWADRLIGPERIGEQLAPFEALLTRAQAAE
jgi:hypothetical protein